MAKPETGRINVLDLHEMLPKAGDKIMVVNTGVSFEVYSIDFEEPQLTISPEEIEALKLGLITFQ